MKSWVLEGSNDDLNWTQLRSHSNDMSLASSPSYTQTYDIPRHSGAYRYFRLKMTDKNSSGSWTFCLGGIEFYGTLFDKNLATTAVPITTTTAVNSTAKTTTAVNSSAVKGTVFTYSGKDFDKNGIVHHLMKGCTRGSGSYPIDATRISNAQGKAEDPLFNISGTCCTNNKISNSWWKFDFKDRKVSPTNYTLKHGYSKGYALKSWDLEGSNDDTNWTKLSTHKNDLSLRKSKTKTFGIPAHSGSYRYFRLIMTDKNSSNSWTFCLGGIELYGVLQ